MGRLKASANVRHFRVATVRLTVRAVTWIDGVIHLRIIRVGIVTGMIASVHTRTKRNEIHKRRQELGLIMIIMGVNRGATVGRRIINGPMTNAKRRPRLRRVRVFQTTRQL